MWRTLLPACLAVFLALPTPMLAAVRVGPWDVCHGALSGEATAPTLTDCRPLTGKIDPQGRELWLRASVSAGRDRNAGLSAVFIGGATSSQFWLNGVFLGGNGRPAATADLESPGLYLASVPIPDRAWRAQDNEIIARLSAFHVGWRLDAPVGGIWIGPASARLGAGLPAVAFAAAGAMLAAMFGFGAIFTLRRTGSSLMLAAMAGVAASQAVVENIRSIAPYAYPLHIWRLGLIWALAATFSMLLVAFAAARFLPRRRTPLLVAAGLAILAGAWIPGFDPKTAAALVAGVLLAAMAAAAGVRDGRQGARPILTYLVVFAAIGLASPTWLLDLSFFVLAAALTLPLLIVEVVRLGRDDRDRESMLTQAASQPDRLTIATARGVQLTPLADIIAILGADDYAEIRLVDGRNLLHAVRLERLEAQFPSRFVRVHRSAIANLAHVAELSRQSGRWRLHMVDGLVLPVSRARLPAVRAALDSAAAQGSAAA